MIDTLTEPETEALEALFAQDLPGGQLAKVKSSVARELIAKGLVKTVTAELGRDRLGAVTVDCHALTTAGHIAYCQWASEQSDAEIDL